MKTLDQIEPRKEVNATNTPGNGANLFIISAPGSYYLSGNITGVSGKNGIRIGANDVTLDLNGFVLTGTAGSLAGITALGGRNLAIRNGTIQDWGGKGVESLFILYSVLEDLRLYKNGSIGLEAHGGSIVRGCVASFNVGAGFNLGSLVTSSGGETAADAVVENCFATGNGGNGFTLRGAAITHCGARFNSGDGIETSAASTITSCLASANVGDGINAAAGSTLTNCTANGNSGSNGIFAGEGSTLLNSTARSNQVEYGIRAELRSSVTHCTVSANDSAAAESGGILVGAQSTVSGCTVTAQTNTDGTATGLTGAGIIAGASSTVRECTVVGNRADGIRIESDPPRGGE